MVSPSKLIMYELNIYVSVSMSESILMCLVFLFSLGFTKENRKFCSENSFFYWDIIYFNTDLHNEDNGGIGSAKAVFCQTGEFR